MLPLKRKLYRRGSSFETTIPMPLLFGLDPDKKYNVVFEMEKESGRWFIRFEERKEAARASIKKEADGELNKNAEETKRAHRRSKL